MATHKFSERQPKDGETVLHCGHLENKPHHFFALPDSFPDGIKFSRPDGSTGRATWMVLCQNCFAAGLDPENCMRADGKWKGDAPAIVQYEPQA